MTTAVATAQNETRIRPGEVGDVNFIGSTWKQSFWRESAWASRLRWAIFNPAHSPIIQRLMERSLVLVACDHETPDDIFGYLVYEHHLAVHFAYTKPAFRRAGIQRALLLASGLPQDLAGIAVTHPTRAWFSRPPFSDKSTGMVLRDGKPGIESLCPLAVNNPYLWLENR